jgi:pimeloyl-ACP methyl ester carboxylesterase
MATNSQMSEKYSGTIFKSFEAEKQYKAAYQTVLSLWPVPSEPIEIKTRFGTTHVNACGAQGNPAMVLIPGFGANSTMWFPNVAALSSQYRIFALDTPGQPGKSIPGLVINAFNSSEWIAEVLDELGLEKAHLAGVSLGGWLALNFAIHVPERVDHVVLLDPAASFSKMSTAFLLHSFMPIMVHPTRSGLIKYFRWMTQGYRVNPAWAELMLLGILNTRPQPPIRATLYTAAQLRSVQVPVLVLIGRRSVIYNPDLVQQRASRLVRNVQAEIILDASHALNAEKSEIVNARILTFCHLSNEFSLLPNHQSENIRNL